MQLALQVFAQRLFRRLCEPHRPPAPRCLGFPNRRRPLLRVSVRRMRITPCSRSTPSRFKPAAHLASCSCARPGRRGLPAGPLSLFQESAHPTGREICHSRPSNAAQRLPGASDGLTSSIR